ncbi:unnamed protein product [marine sediment metagenome]|uniref:Uncharacterized protein n=1 Tax=marine sediment metagenome TaxID=412755 RepID=X1BY96_9ZZZZ
MDNQEKANVGDTEVESETYSKNGITLKKGDGSGEKESNVNFVHVGDEPETPPAYTITYTDKDGNVVEKLPWKFEGIADNILATATAVYLCPVCT